jgi:hypothetical protein
MEKAAHELRYVGSPEPLPTIEVDVDSLDPDGPDVADIVRDALAKHAAAHPSLRATAYMYFTPSVNFGEMTSSEFVIVAGPKRVFDVVLASFKVIKNVRCRPSDMIKPELHMAIAHVEKGSLWMPLDAITWGTVE